MDSFSSPFNSRVRMVGLSRLLPEHIVSGPHVQECGGRLEVAPIPRADELSVTIRADAVRSSKGSMEHVFLPTEETTTSRLLASWHRGGVSAVLDDLASGRDPALVGWLRNLAALLSGLIRLPYTASLTSSSRSPAGRGERDLSGAVVRRLAWHPHTARLAVSLRDDSVRVYQTARPTVPLIKHRLQRAVADLHWKPHSASLLAVACERCVLVWTVEPNSVITRPSGNCCQTLTAPGHAPVTCVRWSPLGDLLMSASPRDGALLVWSVAEDVSVPLSRLRWHGNTFCRWSPDASRVLTATTGQTFRVWETTRWTDERWRSPAAGGQVRAACWSPNGDVALFATSADSVVYSLSFVRVLLKESAPRPIPVIDLATCQLFDRGESFRAGGQVSQLAWDGTGRRLAVAFSDSDAVAVFATELQPHLRVAACGLIRGAPDECPVAIEFQLNLRDTASLCIAWSGGRIQHVRMLAARGAIAPANASLLVDSDFATPSGKAASVLSAGASVLSAGALSAGASVLSADVLALSPAGVRLFSVGTP